MGLDLGIVGTAMLLIILLVFVHVFYLAVTKFTLWHDRTFGTNMSCRWFNLHAWQEEKHYKDKADDFLHMVIKTKYRCPGCDKTKWEEKHYERNRVGSRYKLWKSSNWLPWLVIPSVPYHCIWYSLSACVVFTIECLAHPCLVIGSISITIKSNTANIITAVAW